GTSIRRKRASRILAAGFPVCVNQPRAACGRPLFGPVNKTLYFCNSSDYIYSGASSRRSAQIQLKELRMRVKFSGIVGLSFAVLLGLVLALNVIAADKPMKMANLQGKVQMMSKDNSTITVEQKGGLRRQVVYSGDTSFKMGSSKSNKPGSVDQVKEGNFINC